MSFQVMTMGARLSVSTQIGGTRRGKPSSKSVAGAGQLLRDFTASSKVAGQGNATSGGPSTNSR